MMRPERNANHKMSSTAPIVRQALSNAPSATVPNSSSAIGTGTGKAHAHAIVGRKSQRSRGAADQFGRFGTRLQIAEIENGLHLDEATQISRDGASRRSTTRPTRTPSIFRP